MAKFIVAGTRFAGIERGVGWLMKRAAAGFVVMSERLFSACLNFPRAQISVSFYR